MEGLAANLISVGFLRDPLKAHRFSFDLGDTNKPKELTAQQQKTIELCHRSVTRLSYDTTPRIVGDVLQESQMTLVIELEDSEKYYRSQK